MNNYTQNIYEMKREILNFSKKISKGLNKSESKFIQNIEYGISASGSCLISEIARSLQEDIKLKNTIERLCDNLNTFDNEDIIYRNYIEEIGDIYGDEPVALFDDSDITKIYGKKFEDLDDVIDTLDSKFNLVKKCHEKDIPVLSSLGSAKRIKIENIKLTTLDKTKNDPLAKAFRTLVKKENDHLQY